MIKFLNKYNLSVFFILLAYVHGWAACWVESYSTSVWLSFCTGCLGIAGVITASLRSIARPNDDNRNN